MNTPALVGEIGYVAKDEPDLFLPDRLWLARPRAGTDVDMRWLAYVLSSGGGARKIKDLATGTSGSMKNIPKSKFLGLEIQVPPYLEQAAISQTLTDVDSLIGSLEQLIAKKQSLKQGMMHRLLTGQARPPGSVSEWKTVKIGSIAKVVGGGTPSTKVSEYWGGGIQWFTPAEILSDGSGEVSTSQRTITEAGLAASGARLLPPGTVLVTSRASIGHCGVATVPVATNQGFTSLVPSSSSSTWFLYYWIQQNRGALESKAAGSTFLEISARKVAAIELPVPPLVEQKQIGMFLRDAEIEIDALKQKLRKTLALKHGMMEELLTGRTRLNVAERAA